LKLINHLANLFYEAVTDMSLCEQIVNPICNVAHSPANKEQGQGANEQHVHVHAQA